MKLLAVCTLLVFSMVGPTALAIELPKHYFELMEAGVRPLADETSLEHDAGATLAAAVLYTKHHPANPSFGNKRNLEIALKLGDLYAEASEKDTAENRQDYEWEIRFFLDAYRLLENELGPERRSRWQKAMERNILWFAREVERRLDFPRYQGPFINKSTNHMAIFAASVYLAGRTFRNEEWETLGAQALHRLAAEEQTVDGYWGEFTDNGPAVGYNYLTMACVALYWEHSRDTAALEALRRATNFHKNFTWPNGAPVETVDGRNRHHTASARGHFGFSHWPDGRGYAEFLAAFFTPEETRRRILGRMAQNALYYHEGPTVPSPQELPSSVYRMKMQAGMRKTGPWTVCLSGLIDIPIPSRFTLDRQGHMSIYHDKHGLIVTGANSKRQPELATLVVKKGDRVTTVPLSSRLRMSGERDRLGLGYYTLFAEIEVPKPQSDRLPFRVVIQETGPHGQIEEAQVNLQLYLMAGEVLETAKTEVTLGEDRIDLGPEQIGGWIRHRGWTLHVDPTARLVWPIRPFNPYLDAPEETLSHAVASLTVPVNVKPPEGTGFRWRRQEIEFVLEAETAGQR